MALRQIVLDTETTGLDPQQGHRIIEIAAVELIDRVFTGNHYHYYFNPQREIDPGAQAVHGITIEFLAEKPLFQHKVSEFVEFIKNAELIIHNAPFDVGFLDNEFQLIDNYLGKITDHCTVFDTLHFARQRHPGQKNNLDALCKRYKVDNSQRNLHGALMDAELLAKVYLAMTGGQGSLFDGDEGSAKAIQINTKISRISSNRNPIKIIRANAEEEALHNMRMAKLAENRKSE
jgi:DNA polymerase-3 subunit epsilon